MGLTTGPDSFSILERSCCFCDGCLLLSCCIAILVLQIPHGLSCLLELAYQHSLRFQCFISLMDCPQLLLPQPGNGTLMLHCTLFFSLVDSDCCSFQSQVALSQDHDKRKLMFCLHLYVRCLMICSSPVQSSLVSRLHLQHLGLAVPHQSRL